MPRRQSQRGPAQILIQSLIPLYLKPTVIVNILIKEGLSYRREDMFTDVNRHLQVNFTTEQAKGFDLYQNMPKEFMVSTPFKNDRTYRVIGYGIFENQKTGLPERRIISFYTDGQTNNPDLEAEALEKWGKEEYETDLVLVGFERQFVWENTKTDWSKISAIPEI